MVFWCSRVVRPWVSHHLLSWRRARVFHHCGLSVSLVLSYLPRRLPDRRCRLLTVIGAFCYFGPPAWSPLSGLVCKARTAASCRAASLRISSLFPCSSLWPD